jgi:uncharacterized membrane protein YphA (DoxX/SURF4 family)
MHRLELQERVALAAAMWGVVGGLALLVIGRNPRKAVIPLVVGTAFLCFLVARWFQDKKAVRIVATVVGLILAGATGYLAFHFPLPFS